MPSDWLDVRGVAGMLGLAPKTVYLLSSEACPAARRLISYRLGPKGGKLRFKAEDVQAYLKASKTEVKASPRVLKHLEPKKAAPRRRLA